MSIGIVTGTLKVEGIPVKEYATFDPTYTFINPSQVIPYVRHTGTPRISWSIVGQDPSPNPIYRVRIVWLGHPSSPTEETEIDTDFKVFNNFYVVGVFESLKHIQAKDSGSIYRILVNAKQDTDEDIAGGIFKINFRPTKPVNLTVA